jgi:hypothetical protein
MTIQYGWSPNLTSMHSPQRHSACLELSLFHWTSYLLGYHSHTKSQSNNPEKIWSSASEVTRIRCRCQVCGTRKTRTTRCWTALFPTSGKLCCHRLGWLRRRRHSNRLLCQRCGRRMDRYHRWLFDHCYAASHSHQHLDSQSRINYVELLRFIFGTYAVLNFT